MKRSSSLARIVVALSLATLWLALDLAPLAARGLDGRRVGRPGGADTLDNRARARNQGHNRVDYWDEAEDRHTRKMVVGIVGGIVVGTLIAKPPKNAQPTQVQGQEYYYSEGNYYKPSGDQYEVVNAPTGATVNSLPEGAKKMQMGDDVYFVVGEVFYRPTQTGSEILFEVVPSPFG
jgi:hypothetical protein